MQVLVLGGNRARGLRMDGSYLFSFIAAIIVGCITIYHYYKRPLKLSEIGASEKKLTKMMRKILFVSIWNMTMRTR